MQMKLSVSQTWACDECWEEFKAIQKFEPISRSHPGVVNILQIGRNDDEGYFYYVMELADAEPALAAANAVALNRNSARSTCDVIAVSASAGCEPS